MTRKPTKAPGHAPSPLEPRSERVREAVQLAAIWLGMAAVALVAFKLAGALLLLFAGLVFAAGLQGGQHLLGRIWKVHANIRLAVVVVIFFLALIGFVLFAGVALAAQAQQLGVTLAAQAGRVSGLLREFGIDIGSGGDPIAALKAQLGSQIGGQIDRVAGFVGSAAGALGSGLLIVTLGIYIAAEPQTYQRGIAWLTPERARPRVERTLRAMGRMLRRWVAGRIVIMLIEGSMIFVALWFAGVPLAALLGVVAGLLAFIPTLGALIAGVLIIAVGFSAGTTTGLWAIGVYLVVQLVEGNVLNPIIEKRAVDLAPAVVLASQLLFGVLFGILGVALADPIVALAKVALETQSDEDDAGEAPGTT